MGYARLLQTPCSESECFLRACMEAAVEPASLPTRSEVPPTPMRAASALPGRWSCSVSGISPLQRRLLRLVFCEGAVHVVGAQLEFNGFSRACHPRYFTRQGGRARPLAHFPASARRYATRPTRGFVAARARVNEQLLSPRPVSIAAGVSDVQKSTCTLLMRPTQQ